jgi:drug/metabolite transporter (DMT)-like permease
VSVQSPRLQVIAAAVLFSTGGAAIKTAAFSGMQVASIRSGIAAAALLLWMRGRIAWSWPTLGIGVVYAATLTLFVTSTKLTTSAHAIFLQSTAPLYIVILAPLLLGERFRSRDLVFLAAVGAGLAMCFVGRPEATVTAPNPATGNLLGVICSLTWAFTLMGLRWGERHGARIGISAVVVGNAMAFVVGLPFLSPLPSASAGEWATMAYLGVCQIALAYIFLTSAVAHLPALDVSLLLLLEPVLNPIWTWLVRGEDPGIWALVGGGIIVVATAAKAVYDTSARPALARE